MPMGIVSSDEFEKEADKLSNKIPIKPTKVEILPIEKPGRKDGDTNVPNGIRNLIGDEAITNGRQAALELAKQFNISPSSVSAYTNGSTSTASYDEKPNAPVLQKTKDIIGRRARKKLWDALTNITKDKLEGTKARDLAAIAKDMAVVSKNMEPDVPAGGGNNGPTFVIYTPEVRQENQFNIIKVQE